MIRSIETTICIIVKVVIVYVVMRFNISEYERNASAYVYTKVVPGKHF